MRFFQKKLDFFYKSFPWASLEERVVGRLAHRFDFATQNLGFVQ